MVQNENIISEDEIKNILMKKHPEITEAALKWEIFHYIKDNALTRVGIKQYSKNTKVYSYDYQSLLSFTLDEFLEMNYPEVKTIIFESRQLNEWLNFLMNTNIIYVEVERDCVDYVFSAINDSFGKEHLILLNPSDDIISKYQREDLVVVKTLYSKSPMNKMGRKIKLEKLLVDVVSKDFSFDTRSIEDIVLGIKETYVINVGKMFAYASRRRVKEKVLDIWGLSDD